MGLLFVVYLGEIVIKEELGGEEIYGCNGIIDNVVDMEEEVFEYVWKFLSYLLFFMFDVVLCILCDDFFECIDEDLFMFVLKDCCKVY